MPCKHSERVKGCAIHEKCALRARRPGAAERRGRSKAGPSQAPVRRCDRREVPSRYRRRRQRTGCGSPRRVSLGGGLGERHTPTFRTRCAGDDPCTPIRLEEDLRRHAPLERTIQLRRVQRSDARGSDAHTLTDDSQPAFELRRTAAIASRSAGKFFDGMSLPTATTVGSGASAPGGIRDRFRVAPRARCRQATEAIENVGGETRQGHDRCAPIERRANRRSSSCPARASFGGSTIGHMSSCTWCSHVAAGPRAQSGERKRHRSDLD